MSTPQELIQEIQLKLTELAKAIANDTGNPVPQPGQTPVAQAGNLLTLKASSGRQSSTTGTAKVVTGMMVQFSNGRTTPITATDDGVTFTTREPAADTADGLARLSGSNLKIISVPGQTTTPTNPGDNTTPPVVIPDPDLGQWQRRTLGEAFLNLGMGAGADHVAMPGVHGTNYTFSPTEEIREWAGKGVKEYRIGFIGGRVFKSAGSTEMYRGQDQYGRNYTMDEILRVLRDCADAGVGVMLDNHVYGYFPSNGAGSKSLIGSAQYTSEQFANHVYAMLQVIKQDPKAWKALKRFDLINEPYQAAHDAKALRLIYKAVIAKCSSIAEHVIWVLEGPGYSSARNWAANIGDTWDDIVDPRGPEFVEVSAHCYLDRGADGYYDENGDGKLDAKDDILGDGETWETLVQNRVGGFIDWCKRKNRNGNIGEFIVSGDLPNLLNAGKQLMDLCFANGINIYVFGAGKNYGTGNAHNISLTAADTGGRFDNSKMLALFLSYLKR